MWNQFKGEWNGPVALIQSLTIWQRHPQTRRRLQSPSAPQPEWGFSKSKSYLASCCDLTTGEDGCKCQRLSRQSRPTRRRWRTSQEVPHGDVWLLNVPCFTVLGFPELMPAAPYGAASSLILLLTVSLGPVSEHLDSRKINVFIQYKLATTTSTSFRFQSVERCMFLALSSFEMTDESFSVCSLYFSIFSKIKCMLSLFHSLLFLQLPESAVAFSDSSNLSLSVLRRLLQM